MGVEGTLKRGTSHTAYYKPKGPYTLALDCFIKRKIRLYKAYTRYYTTWRGMKEF